MTDTAAEFSVAGAEEARRIIVMMGAPGAGKGTQAEHLAKLMHLAHVSTGKLFRDAISGQLPLGAKVRSHVESGSLVPDEVTVKVVDERIHLGDAASGVILDGFPRTCAQAVALDEILARHGEAVTAALYIEVGIEELLVRLTGRRVCALDDHHVYHVVARPPRKEGVCDIDGAELVQRNDDKPATVQSRLDRQLPPMYEVIDYYTDSGVLFGVQGDQPAADVTEDLLRALAAASRSR
ncbi:MAG: adenylate kinase family protein [Chloroflexota bacterium]